jgi:hypothetical protein
MPQTIDPLQPITLATLWPWLAAAATSAVAIALSVFRWVFQTALIDELKELKAEIKAMGVQVSRLNIEVAVMTRAVNELEQDQRRDRK